MRRESAPRIPREDINVCFLNPALLPDWFWLPVAHGVAQQGFDYSIPNLRREDPNASLKANVDIIEEAMTGQDNQYIVALSRGVEYAVRYLDRLNKQNQLNKVVGWLVMSSVGPRGYEAVENAEIIPMSRHTAKYRRGLTQDENGLEQMDIEIAKQTLFHDLKDQKLLDQTIQDMIRNRPLAESEISSVPRLKKRKLPLSWYIGMFDEVDNVELSAQIASQKFGVQPKYENWGHIAPLTHPSEVAQIVVEEADQAARIRRRSK